MNFRLTEEESIGSLPEVKRVGSTINMLYPRAVTLQAGNGEELPLLGRLGRMEEYWRVNGRPLSADDYGTCLTQTVGCPKVWSPRVSSCMKDDLNWIITRPHNTYLFMRK